jgi:hypothetical protein
VAEAVPQARPVSVRQAQPVRLAQVRPQERMALWAPESLLPEPAGLVMEFLPA